MAGIERNRPASLRVVQGGSTGTELKAKEAKAAEVKGSGVRALGGGESAPIPPDKFEVSDLSVGQVLKLVTGAYSGSEKVADGKFVGAGGQTFPPGTSLSDIPGVMPRTGKEPERTVIYVNGILTTQSMQQGEMQAIADRTNSKVIGIHNGTQGMIPDLLQCLGDKADKGGNGAVDTLADTVYQELKAGRDVSLMGYSQGGLITARALFDVERRLRLEDGLSKADSEKLLGKVQVETFGAASTHYPDGPQYVHYVNNADLVPVAFGLGSGLLKDAFNPLKDFLTHAGKGAQVHYFTDVSLNPIANHMLASKYLAHRVPFDEARQGRFQD